MKWRQQPATKTIKIYSRRTNICRKSSPTFLQPISFSNSTQAFATSLTAEKDETVEAVAL